MTPALILCIITGYFLLLLIISWFTSRKADQFSYYTGNKASPWYAVAFGLIGDSLSGVTFVSVPGAVATASFSYMQIVLGYVVGYLVIAYVLLPVYYKMQLTSIYSFLGVRFGHSAQKTGSFYFIISRLIGAAFRLYISVMVLQLFIFNEWNIPFAVTVSCIILLILVYTYRGGIKTLVWTDTLQSSFLLLGVILSIVAIATQMELNLSGLLNEIKSSGYNQVFVWDWKAPTYFWKQFFSGALIAIVMTGLDQNMMQKNLSIKTLPHAQKNLIWFSIVLVFVNALFVSLGALLYSYAASSGIELPTRSDHLFPMLALEHLGNFAALVFILGITAATFSSADSVLTTLTTSFCIDILRMDPAEEGTHPKQRRNRHLIHIAFAIVLLLVIVIFEALSSESVIHMVFTVAGYTYGPLLGLFAFGLFSNRQVRQNLVIWMCLLPPVLCYFISQQSPVWFNGYTFGYELLLLNGLLTFALLYLISTTENFRDERQV